MARAHCTASQRLCAPSFRMVATGASSRFWSGSGTRKWQIALNRLGPAGPTVSEYSSLATEIPASVVMFGGFAVIAPPFVPFPPPAPLSLLLRSSPDWWLLTLDPRVGKGR